MMNQSAPLLAAGAACLFWTAWREHRSGNYRDRTLLAVFGITLSSASGLCAAL